ncbi:hypothetical protein [Aromatoleum petrolei]|uniref:Uncharacterized protein n=1 Tax=Aromatoleum petrolei TaxID=76116 RepID=A0ABX1ML84_9RHOO|nr:hypothetical protein [Aromatoleum petrolei]NMF87418.1 hypothetical protein [Aromatoleum petrolei]QTQ35784.1 Uncharacterized protein ToN1_16290 [Aromatoleum petrolei]
MKTKALQSSFVQRSFLLAATVVAGAALFMYLTAPRAAAATAVEVPATASVQDNYAVDETLALKLFVHRGDYAPMPAQGRSS